MRKIVTPEIVFGAGALGLAGQYAHNFSGRRVLLVTDQGVVEAGWAGRVEDSLTSVGCGMIYFDSISLNQRAEEVMLGVRVYEEEACELIVSIGGGSPMDCSKMIAAVVADPMGNAAPRCAGRGYTAETEREHPVVASHRHQSTSCAPPGNRGVA